jgi:hypothetical protein
MAVFARPSTAYGRIAEVAVSVEVGAPSTGGVMTASFEPVVEAALSKALVRGSVLPGVVGPFVLCAPSERQRNSQSGKCKYFTHNLPSNTDQRQERFEALLGLRPWFRRSVVLKLKKSDGKPRYSCREI